jgi:hypothetical protein
LWLAARQVDHEALDTALTASIRGYLFPLVALSLLIQVFRALRWRVELQNRSRGCPSCCSGRSCRSRT